MSATPDLSTLNGHAPLRVAINTADYTVLAGELGTVFTNEGDAGTQVLTLPPATVGLWYEFHVMAAYEMRIDPSGTETIGLPSTGVQGAAGKYLSADAVGEWLRLVCVKAGQWQARGYFGTWTAEG